MEESKAKLPPPLSPNEAILVGLDIKEEFFIALPKPKPGTYYEIEELPSGRYSLYLRHHKK